MILSAAGCAHKDRGDILDIPKIERFILHDYIEPDVLWISSIRQAVLLRGLRRSFLIVFLLALAFIILVISDTEISLNSFVTLAVLPIPIIAIASTIYHKQIIVTGSEKIYTRHKKQVANKEKNQRIGSSIVIIISGSLMSFLRAAPEMFSAAMPLLTLVAVIATGGMSFVIMFQICGQLYKIYLIKRYCPYLKTPADARYYKADEDETNSNDS